jgi:hypothetical protein
MTDSNRPPRSGPVVGRRKFLLGLGAGAAGAAGAAVLPGTAAAETAAAGAAGAPGAGTAATPADRFGRIFPQLPSFSNGDPRLNSALTDIGKAGGIMDAKDNLAVGPVQLITDPAQSTVNRDNPTHTAGTTFFGQFLDHDMTFDITSQLGVPTVPENTTNNRTPALDLDSVYGRGRVADPQFYDAADPVKLRIESGGLFEDVPRGSDGRAIISDPRNDENMIISGLQAAFITFHNRVIDLLRSQGAPNSTLFDQARQLVTWHYHWIILHEFLPQVIGQPMVNDILNNGRKFYRPEPGPAFIPVEFQGAAYRFGHSMVRPSYRANLAGNPDGSAFFGFIFDPAGEGQADPVDLRGGRRARRRFIGWQTFFDFGDGAVRPNKRIDRHISTPLFRLPLGAIASNDPPISLATRNLLRQVTWSIPAGQRIAQTMGVQMLHLQELADYGLALENQTPLWYYTLAEAELLADGLTLGPVGGRIVGEVFIGLMQLDPRSFLRTQPGWTPTLPSRTAGQFGMVDLLRFAKLDPASRGQ